MMLACVMGSISSSVHSNQGMYDREDRVHDHGDG
jgi:hypothetical protein